uniref:Retrovirus-related Pol polyprotein from transposon TNT 1-94 n=1 Tax=Lygus hesperus TaxID=30085 RepID=A0A0A9YFM0_LYGHE
MSDSTRESILVKLDGQNNYNDWKFAMRMSLVYDQIDWCITEGAQIELTAENVAALGIDDEQRQRVEQLRYEQDKKALAKIALNIKPCCYVHVRSAKTALEAWTSLQNAYESKGLTRRLTLLRTLLGLKMRDFPSMEKYVNEVMSVAHKLEDIGKPLDDELVAVIMLSGLTEKYDPMVMAIENSKTTLTTDYVKGQLLVQDKGATSSESAYFSKSKDKKSKGKKTYECYGCGSTKHLRYQCPEYKGESSESNSTPKDNAEKKKNKGDKKKAFLVALSAEMGTADKDSWVLDSGASSHMTCRADWLDSFVKNDCSIVVANNQRLKGEGAGDVMIDHEKISKISSVTLVPELRTNLLSVSKIAEKNCLVVFSSDKCTIYDANCKIQGDALLTVPRVDGLYSVNFKQETCLMTTADEHTLWHRRLGHLNRVSLNLLKDGLATGVTFRSVNTQACVACLEGKQTRLPYKKSKSKRAGEVLELLHSDLCGPMPDSSWSGARYIFTILDDCSRKLFVYFLKTKDEVTPVFQEFQIMVENETGKSVKVLRTDNGGEYVNSRFEAYLKSKGIRHQLTVPYTPEQNGAAERAQRTVVERARTMMMDSKVDTRMWAEAVNTASYLYNRSPHKAIPGKTPEEVWTKKKVDLKHLRIFGCVAYGHVPKEKRTKWNAKSKPYIFVGYCTETKGYRLYDPRKPGDIVRRRDVTFLEDKFQIDESATPIQPQDIFQDFINHSVDESDDNGEEAPIEDNEDNQSSHRTEESSSGDDDTLQSLSTLEGISESSNEDDAPLDQPAPEEGTVDSTQYREPEERRYPIRDRKKKTFSDYVVYHTVRSSEKEKGPEPTTVAEAMSRKDGKHWKRAMQAEYQSLQDNGTWVLIDRPVGKKVIKNKWDFLFKNGL